MSRGAWLAAIGAGIDVNCCNLCFGKRSGLPSVSFVLAALVAIVFVDWLGQTEMITRTVRHIGPSSDVAGSTVFPLARWPVGGIELYPAGSGLGTYRFVYPLTQRAANSTQYYHAENQYLEALADAGLLGLGLLMVMIVIVAVACRRLLRSRPKHRRSPLEWRGSLLSPPDNSQFFRFWVVLTGEHGDVRTRVQCAICGRAG